jgi:hypothetical protein
MASLRFTDVQARPTEFLDFTSLTLEEFPHSSGFSGEGPLPCAISLKLCRYSSIVGHPLHRPSDLRMPHAKHHSPDSRQPDYHC